MLSLTARGLTTGEVAAHFAEVYGAKVYSGTVSRDTISADHRHRARADGRLAGPAGSTRWCSQGATVVKVSGGQVTNRPIYVAIGVTVNGERDILGLWAGDGHEGGKVLARRPDRDQEPGRR